MCKKGSKQKEMPAKTKKILFVIGTIIAVLSFIFLPVAIDRFFAYEWYMVWCKGWEVESPMKVGEWLGFLGSYLGVAGTIIIGMIAYRQTNIIASQGQELSELQRKITDFQIHPVIHIKETQLEVENKPNRPLSTAKMLEDHYFAIYGEQRKNAGKNYILISISFEDKGIIPTVRCEISDLEWEIAGHKYCIGLDAGKRKVSAYDKLYILIDNSDLTADQDNFFQDLDWHEHFASIGKWGYDKSILKVKINFVNQKEYCQMYELTYRIKSYSGGLKADSLFLRYGEGIGDGAGQADTK